MKKGKQVTDDNEPPTYQEATATYGDMEAQFAWDDKTIRQTFIRKVYAILMVQLLVTVGIVALFSFWRQFPWNIILLVLFTLSMAFMMGFVSSFYNTKSVVLCLGITALVCLSVTIFSFQSKIDVTSCQGVLFSLCMVMLLCAITLSIVVPFGYVPWLHALYAVGASILFTLFLAFDTQLLLGNKRYSISPEEYVFATLSLYLDIIYLFSFLLQILGGGRD
ncbi:fas apoptotic inhibitory molecule 2b isoform X3 [Acanthopagrus latus]|uniref:fas apoptotic inhibitory molecule 2b isoform X3 n=1 Tax=Acanthopagrus latus TaxID=8177 RepID=UPI00187CC7A8|nr:fas apoptotic inhibitory molecule 2b isoform X3 [Acanthopagrus latus]